MITLVNTNSKVDSSFSPRLIKYHEKMMKTILCDISHLKKKKPILFVFQIAQSSGKRLKAYF